MFTIRSVREAEFDNLPQIRRERELWGGSIILYRRAWSFVTLSGSAPQLMLVRPHQSRVIAGLKCSLGTLLFGWWSFAGLLSTPRALAHNLSGGLDVTRIYAGPPPPVPGSKEAEELYRELQIASDRIEARGRVGIVITIVLALILFILLVGFVLHYDVPPKP
ncbi:MAG TPA: hypothetical protein VLW52_17460 [Opitutaceae bacterium]|nr:hypothetical protein [Opitutaceae bacterium]